MPKAYFLQKTELHSFLGKLLPRYQVMVPTKKGKHRFYKQYTGPADDVVIGEVRAFEPLKAFFTRAREVVAESFKPDLPHQNDKPYAIIGVKACDLKGFKVQDHVFGDENADPIYSRNREQNLIISADCTCVIDTCFCLALGVKPQPKENFDLNFSAGSKGFVVEVGSAKGQALVDEFPGLFSEAKEENICERNDLRIKVLRELEENIKRSQVPSEENFKDIIEKNFESGIWGEEARTCVECGACNTICPTCHCFLLYDQGDAKKMERLRAWDSCMLMDFARVAGGGNPRKRLWARLRNRFEKKFDFFPKVAGIYACTGCGRCISACPAKIDIRKVLRRLV